MVSYSLYLSGKEHLFTVLTGPPNNVIDLFSDTDCISARRMLKQPKLGPRRCGWWAMINAPLSQSLTSTRATMPVWYTPSQIESSPPLSCLWCNRTWYDHFSQDTYPLFISSNKVLVWANSSSRLQYALRGSEVNTGIHQRHSPLRT